MPRIRESGQPSADDGTMAARNRAAMPWGGMPLGEDAGNLIANTSAETEFASVFSAPADTLPMWSIIVVRAFGVFSTTGTPTMTMRLKIGGADVLTSSALTLSSGVTDKGWEFYAQILVQGCGAASPIDAQGTMIFNGVCSSVGQDSTPTIDTTIENDFSLSADFSAASPSNSIKLRQLCVWVYTP